MRGHFSAVTAVFTEPFFEKLLNMPIKSESPSGGGGILEGAGKASRKGGQKGCRIDC